MEGGERKGRGEGSGGRIISASPRINTFPAPISASAARPSGPPPPHSHPVSPSHSPSSNPQPGPPQGGGQAWVRGEREGGSSSAGRASDRVGEGGARDRGAGSGTPPGGEAGEIGSGKHLAQPKPEGLHRDPSKLSDEEVGCCG